MLFYGYRKSYRAKGAAVKGGYQCLSMRTMLDNVRNLSVPQVIICSAEVIVELDFVNCILIITKCQ